MDAYTSGGIGAGIMAGVGIAYRIYLAVNHHRLRSTCCGKEISASIDVEETTPKATTIQVKPE